ncbi:hypothetical protein RHIZ_02795 [Rhizobium skierniewicense]|uniref:hypothetical protein n=1 Tax=Rhizobium skierniewicense TaxID=984260 RepID=UPI001FAC775C|nr:hypothetical protein [Rhizobium skierniewicense]MCI9864868.1 hypothetical protein [Rhizobium skierniewicense]
MYEKIDDLRTDIGVGFKVVPITFRRGFSGTGVERKRDVVATVEVAQRLAKHINWVHKFYEGDRRVEVADLADFLFEHLMAVPDDVAKAATSKRPGEEEASEQFIFNALIDALLANWTVKYEPSTPSLPGQGVVWHGPKP